MSRRRRIERPAVFRLIIWLAPRLLDAYLRLVDWTSQKTVFGLEHDGTHRDEATLFVSFHQGLLYFVQHYRDRDGVIMASRSKDGDIIAAILHRFGYRSVRGSTHHGGREAREEMTEMIRAGRSGGLVCDGPRGPYGDVKVGIIRVARNSGVPLVPCAYWTSRRILLKNWDRTLIPLPFGRIYFAYAQPIHVSPDATPEECDELRELVGERIRDRLHAMQQAAGEPIQDFRATSPKAGPTDEEIG